MQTVWYITRHNLFLGIPEDSRDAKNRRASGAHAYKLPAAEKAKKPPKGFADATRTEYYPFKNATIAIFVTALVEVWCVFTCIAYLTPP